MKYLARKRCTRLSQIAVLDKSHSGWSGAPRPYKQHFTVSVSSIRERRRSAWNPSI